MRTRFSLIRARAAAEAIRRRKRRPDPGIRLKKYMSVGQPRQILNFVLEVG